MQAERQNAFKLIGIQSIIVLMLSALFLFSSVKAACSVLLGGLCCILPSLYFANKLFKYIGARSAKKAISAFYFGEIIKLAMVGALSIFVFKYVAILPMNYFIGFIVAQIAFWIAPNVLLARQMKLTGGV